MPNDYVKKAKAWREKEYSIPKKSKHEAKEKALKKIKK